MGVRSGLCFHHEVRCDPGRTWRGDLHDTRLAGLRSSDMPEPSILDQAVLRGAVGAACRRDDLAWAIGISEMLLSLWHTELAGQGQTPIRERRTDAARSGGP